MTFFSRARKVSRREKKIGGSNNGGNRNSLSNFLLPATALPKITGQGDPMSL
jgi:hypothetical protein